MTTMQTIARTAMTAATRIYCDELAGIIDRHFPAHSNRKYHLAFGVDGGYRIIESATLRQVEFYDDLAEARCNLDYWNAL